MDWSGLLASVMSLWQSFPTLPLAGKIAGVLAIVIGLVKSSALQPYWAKLGPWQALVAPVLGVVTAILSIQPLSWAGIWLGLSGGMLAVALSNVLNSVMAMPGVGPLWVSIIQIIERLLNAPAPAPVVQAKREQALARWKKKS